MKYIITVLIGCFFYPAILFSQANYKKGLVVNAQGDTLIGYINYREWDQNPKTFTFKKSLEEKDEKVFFPENTKYFSIENVEAYQQYAGRITNDKTELNDLSNGIDTSTVVGTFFLKVLQKGKNLALFSYTDNWKTRFFIQKKNDTTPQELFYRRFRIDKAIKTSRIYVGQLGIAAVPFYDNSPELKRKIASSEYVANDMIDIVSRINGLSVEEIKQAIKIRLSHRSFIGAGLNRAVMDVEGNITFAYNQQSKLSYFPKVVLGRDVFFNPNVQRFFLRGEASFTGGKYQFETEYRGYRLTQLNVSVAPQLIWNIYNKNNFKLYIGGGGMVNYSIYSNNESYLLILQTNGEKKMYQDSPYKFVPVWFSGVLRSGVSINNKVEIALLQTIKTPITNYTSFSWQTKATQLQVSYFLNNNSNK
ncbi:hypothetical protein [Adhaeribacter aquaticus]|uniref:hypothetical protein n=1 Tax=Adhaeribacter aquaticus TaxID=299567 RepID=UPI000416076F|nr:hypothetical protein [Adhaeribacter aquaticus]